MPDNFDVLIRRADSPCPFLLRIYDAYYSDEKTYIVLEFCGNGALDDCLQKKGPMPEPVCRLRLQDLTKPTLW